MSGWQEASDLSLFDFLNMFETAGLKHVLCTDIDRDGTLQGFNRSLYADVKQEFGHLQLQASGGASRLEDLRNLNADGVIIGKALYEGPVFCRPSAGGNRMLTKRIIACLDVKDGRVVKGVQFRNHVDMGDILELSQRYAGEGVDELVFYDITASSDGRVVDKSWVNQIARRINIPFCVAGGIRSSC